MSVTSANLYSRNGTLRGSYVYLLVCRDDDGPIYIKIGISGQPTQRLRSLRNGCPVTPRYFYTCHVRSRFWAEKVEMELLASLAKYRVQGEWLKVDWADKPEFNAIIHAVLAAHSDSVWTLRWEGMPVERWARALAARKGWVQHRWRSRGKAYQDFTRHQK